jgi:hypothetical protein
MGESMTYEPDRIRYSPDYVRSVADDAVRAYLVESGITRVADFFEDGPSGVSTKYADPGLLMLGYVGDRQEAFYLVCATGAVYYLFSKKSVFVNSSPQQFEASLQMYLDVTYGELAGQDNLVEERLRSELVGIDPAAIEDSGSFWNDTLGDVSMGVYGDDPE